jgi:rubrerythrin
VAFPSLDAVLAFAIAREEEAAVLYRTMAAEARTVPLRLMLGELEAEERKHKSLLEKFRAGAPVPPPGAKAPNLGLTDALTADSSGPDGSAQDVLILAAQKEARAADLYGRLAAAASTDEMRSLFDYLAGQELRHKFRLENEYEARVLTED